MKVKNIWMQYSRMINAVPPWALALGLAVMMPIIWKIKYALGLVYTPKSFYPPPDSELFKRPLYYHGPMVGFCLFLMVSWVSKKIKLLPFVFPFLVLAIYFERLWSALGFLFAVTIS